jgi:hypothetical protein
MNRIYVVLEGYTGTIPILSLRTYIYSLFTLDICTCLSWMRLERRDNYFEKVQASILFARSFPCLHLIPQQRINHIQKSKWALLARKI